MVTQWFLSLFLGREKAKLFAAYFDKAEYRRKIRNAKVVYFKPVLMVHYLIKGKNKKAAAAQFYNPNENKKTFLEELIEMKGKRKAASGRLFCVCLSLSLVLKGQALTFKID